MFDVRMLLVVAVLGYHSVASANKCDFDEEALLRNISANPKVLALVEDRLAKSGKMIGIPGSMTHDDWADVAEWLIRLTSNGYENSNPSPLTSLEQLSNCGSIEAKLKLGGHYFYGDVLDKKLR